MIKKSTCIAERSTSAAGAVSVISVTRVDAYARACWVGLHLCMDKEKSDNLRLFGADQGVIFGGEGHVFEELLS